MCFHRKNSLLLPFELKRLSYLYQEQIIIVQPMTFIVFAICTLTNKVSELFRRFRLYILASMHLPDAFSFTTCFQNKTILRFCELITHAA